MAKIVPNALSSGNLLMGLIAIGLSYEKHFFYAMLAILLGMIFDALDGNMARMLNAGSEFGKQMDSLCDLITFGAAPAFLLYMQIFSQQLSWWHLIPLLAFPLCGALRLARFNTAPPPAGGGFTGIPITAAGGILAVCSLSWSWFSLNGIVLFTAALAFLMVSTIRYPDLKSVPFLKSNIGIITSLSAVALYMVFLSEWLFLPLVAYAFVGPVLSLKPKG